MLQPLEEMTKKVTKMLYKIKCQLKILLFLIFCFEFNGI